MKLSNKAYDFLKDLCLKYGPAAIALFVGLNQLWHFTEYGEQISGSANLVLAFIGACLGVSSKNYWAEQETE